VPARRVTLAFFDLIGNDLSFPLTARWLLIILLFVSLPTRAAEPDVNTFLSGIATLRATVPDTASSAVRLGTSREGTAIVIGGDGLLVTIGYLVLHASEVKLRFQSGANATAQVIAHDVASGLALLRAELPPDTLPLDTGRSQRLDPGQRLIAIDHRGSEYAAAVEFVSAQPFSGASEYYLERTIRTTPVRQHISGAALIDRDARLVGIGAFGLAQVADDFQPATAGNLFVPIDRLMAAIGEMLIDGHSSASSRPWLGVSVAVENGALVISDTHRDGPASAAGIMKGDELIAIDRYRIREPEGFYQHFWHQYAAGQSLNVLLARDRQLIDVPVTAINALEQLECKAC
jgi:S1-C subfamily serine protease